MLHLASNKVLLETSAAGFHLEFVKRLLLCVCVCVCVFWGEGLLFKYI